MNKSNFLTPFSWFYGAIVGARVKLYEKGVLKSFDLESPTISIGNLTVGGTGKTPLVAFVAGVLAEKGEKVCILTRGYKRENESERVLVSDGEKILADVKKAGDEPLELAQKLLGTAAVVADADRAAAGRWARKNLGATAFVLDDAFQHLKVKRDLDILCIDADNAFGNEKLLPAGILREPLQNLRRADAVVITRANLVSERRIEDLKARVLQLNPKARIFVSKNKTASLTDLKEFPAKAQSPHSKEKPADNLAFCALGNAENFFEQLRKEKFNLVSVEKFSDHHFYTQSDIDELEKAANAKGATALLTTAKDAVKLKNLKFNLPCFVVESEMIFDNEDELRRLIIKQIGERTGRG